jgi:2-polyprenyl-3-methyl-5-hydroxy-6-metoxy-1,4-benzoquinol methylase
MDADVAHSSRYTAGITAPELRKLYSASSAHALMDQVVQCRTCALVFVNPRPDPQLIVAGYSDAEDRTFVEQNGDRIRTFRRTIGRVLRGMGKNSGAGMRLLDVGCAGGAFLVAAREAGFEVAGVEPSRWMADFGRKSYGLDIIDGILRPETFAPGTFDVVTLWDVIEHVPDPHELLGLIHRLLKPEGWLVVNYPDIGSLAARTLGRRWPFWLSVHLLYYTRPTMRQQLMRAGFAPKSFAAFWQTLPLGYVLERAAAYFRPLALLHPVLKILRMSGLPCTYNMGQTLVVSRRD